MSLIQLSNDVLNQIFLHLDIQDLWNMMHSCTTFSNLLRNENKLWKEKFKDRWSNIFFDAAIHENWLELVVLRLKISKNVREVVKNMSLMCYPISPEKHTPVNVFQRLTLHKSHHLEFVFDALTRLVFLSSEEFEEHWTFSYYAKHLYLKVKMLVLEKKLSDYMALPQSNMLLFEGALLLSHWINMDHQDLSYSSDSLATLNWIVERVKLLVMEMKDFPINGSHTEPTERETLVAISQVLFIEMKFLNLSTEIDEVEDRDRFVGCGCFCAAAYSVDMALASDTRICHNTILCIIYQEVARRMGIRCEPIFCNENSHLVLRWLEFPEHEDGYTYVVIFNKGSLVRADNNHRIGPFLDWEDEYFFYTVEAGQGPATTRDILSDLIIPLMNNDNSEMCLLPHGDLDVKHLDATLARLLCAVSPSSEYVKRFANFCLSNDTLLDDAIQLSEALRIPCVRLKELLRGHKAKIAEKMVCRRSPSIKFAVGLVVVYRDTSACVISSWDIQYVGPHGNSRRPQAINLKQPFYHVLLDKGKFEYVPEDQLAIHVDPKSVCLKNRELGLHFVKFDGCIYVPNTEKKNHFPDDEKFARTLISNLVYTDS